MKEKLKEEEASRLVAEARAAEKDEVLRQSSLALLEAANIPADALDRVPNNSPANAMSVILASHQLTQELLVKGKGALARMHWMISPRSSRRTCLLSIANATGDFEELYPKVLVPANIIVDRLEEESNLPEERETPQG
nr:uncharacterized protein LOC127303382 [Lolium perenne]